ncbi:hypothetical protein JCM10449v2_006001 [Rhodotorula kratochvilovae]
MYRNLSADAIDLLDKVIEGGLPPLLDPELIEDMATFDDATAAYLADDANWETLVQRKKGGGLWNLIDPLSDAKNDEGQPQELTLRYGGRTQHGNAFHVVRQKPRGGKEIIAEYLIKIINAARGGFVFLVAPAASTALFDIFAFVEPFFKEGGKFVICVPVRQVETGAVLHLGVWAKVLEERAEKEGGGLRFFFNSEWNEPSFGNEIVAVLPGRFGKGKKRMMLYGSLFCDLSSESLGLEAVTARTMRGRQQAPQSAETVHFTIRDVDENVKNLDGLARFWMDEGKNGHIVWNAPALHKVFSSAVQTSPEDDLAAIKSDMLKEAFALTRKGGDEDVSVTRKKSNIEFLIGVLATPQHHSLAGSDGSDEDDVAKLDEPLQFDEEEQAAHEELRGLVRAAVGEQMKQFTQEKRDPQELFKQKEAAIAQLIEEKPQLAEVLKQVLEAHKPKPRKKNKNKKNKNKPAVEDTPVEEKAAPQNNKSSAVA